MTRILGVGSQPESLKSLVRDQQNLPAVRVRLKSGKAAAVSDESSEEANSLDSQMLWLQQMLGMSQEELKTVRAGADKQIQDS